jgi:asparagine N-glycosylation enzyme membrane subunit Stt3
MEWLEWMKYALRIIIKIVLFIAFLYAVRWMGVKGMFGLFLGMTIMAYLLLSENPLFVYMIRLMQGETKPPWSKE